MENLNLSMVTPLTVKGRKVRFENKATGLKIFRNREGNFEILVNGQSKVMPNGEYEFTGCTLYHTGIVLDTLSGRKAIFLFKEETFFKCSDKRFEFDKAFLLGGIFVSSTGKAIKEHGFWKLNTVAA